MRNEFDQNVSKSATCRWNTPEYVGGYHKDGQMEMLKSIKKIVQNRLR